MRHYEFTEETKVTDSGITLHRIRCTKEIERLGVKVGDLGGWIEKYENLSGSAWVSGNAQVSGNARVDDNAWVSGDARVFGNARVSGDARVSGNARVYG
ncbi:MAG: hypothetical protein LBJ39_00925 [Tannerellaceae bacterium]|jgi:carbonic anhydrase/acetyltransferase-like protein (isoleucine patch superfamily)|nr:hypothetical protein [Tannerellaceae bacterium]